MTKDKDKKKKKSASNSSNKQLPRKRHTISVRLGPETKRSSTTKEKVLYVTVSEINKLKHNQKNTRKTKGYCHSTCRNKRRNECMSPGPGYQKYAADTHHM